MTNNKRESKKLAGLVIKGMQEKKGIDLVSLDLTKIENSVASYFIICHGTSRTQVSAIADSVLEFVKKQNKENPWHKEGMENAEWILIDFADVVVHIFQEETRKFYQLESLWADAKTTTYENVE